MTLIIWLSCFFFTIHGLMYDTGYGWNFFYFFSSFRRVLLSGFQIVLLPLLYPFHVAACFVSYLPGLVTSCLSIHLSIHLSTYIRF